MLVRRLSLALLLGLAAACGHAQPSAGLPALAPSEVQAQAAELSARFLTRFHYDARPLDDAMSAKLYQAYVDALDGEKLFFTQADLDSFAPLATQLDDAIWNQDLSGPFAVFNRYRQRAVERMDYARSLLKSGFDFSGQDSYETDRKKAAWPKDQAELDALWRRRTMNDWLRLKLAGKRDEDIRKTLDKRYASRIERVRQSDGEDAFQVFMDAYAESADPHTDYLGPRAAEDFAISMKLSVDGTGATLQQREDYVTVLSLVPGSPAAKSGKLKPGDRIVAVGQGERGPMTDVIGWRSDDVLPLIRGKRGTAVRLEVLPADAGVDGRHELVTLVRQKVVMQDQAAQRKLLEVRDGRSVHKIGVIDLPSFYSDFGARREGDKDFRSSSRDVARLLGELKAAGAEGVVMDLRDNPGGSLEEAGDLTGLFIDRGPVVEIRSADGNIDVEGDEHPGMAWSGPMAVLVNRGSASAAEIFAAAIQDYGRGLIIGQPTFGKGTVQNLVDLDHVVADDDRDRGGKPRYGQLKMTIAEFFRIDGGSTQLKGVTPDIAFPNNGDEREFGESTYANVLPWTRIAPAPYRPVADARACLPQLEARHEARVASSPAWKLMLDELAQDRTIREQSAVSLNLARRQAERRQQDALQASFRARHRAIDGGTGYDDGPDDGLDAGERSIASELKTLAEAKKAKDPQLQETARILADAIELIRADPSLARQVLPYSGKRRA